VQSEARTALDLSNTEITDSNTAPGIYIFPRFYVPVTLLSSCTKSLNDSIFRIMNLNGPENTRRERRGGKEEKEINYFKIRSDI
jgi:hypothetical protein